MRLIARVFLLVFSVGCLSCSAQAASQPEGTHKYDYMKRFTKAFELVRGSYVRDVDNEEIMDGAIKGMLENLDPHSTFMTKEDYKDMMEGTTGEFFGIGIEMSSENNQLIVVSPFEDTPAEKAGLRAGDFILAVDGESTQNMSAQEAASKIRGPKGTEVELLILHKNSTKPETVVIKRDTIPLVSVKARFLDEEGFVWLRITRFSEKTTAQVKEAIEKLQKQGEIKGIVLDLRNNPGGLFRQSATVANLFLSKGTIVSMKGRGGEVLESYEANPKETLITAPMVVLVNSGTASAAEIVAGALQDQKRALLIGERTFGKGSVQNIIPLEDETAIKLTIALYYTPSGRSIQAEGIVPDIEIPFEIPSDDKKDTFNLGREKDLSGHLELSDKEGAKKKEDKGGSAIVMEDDTKRFLDRDNQLRMALQLVRGLPRLTQIQVQ